jgi:uncharacterized BrkB/YihY/UPF0761 family membrane protein
MLWLLASWGFSTYISKVADVGAIYGAFAGAIVLVAWIWLTNVALLFGAELNAEIERENELREGVPSRDAQPTGAPGVRGRIRDRPRIAHRARHAPPPRIASRDAHPVCFSTDEGAPRGLDAP